MTRPIASAFGEVLYSRTAPLLAPGDEQRGWDFLVLCGAVGAMFQQVHDLVRTTDAGPGWSPLLDPARAPLDYALPWLAHNVAGVDLTPGLTEAEQRAEVTTPPPWQRGTPDAMRDAAKKTLTGARTARLLERTADEWTDTLITRTAETIDAAATFAAARAQQPAERLLIHVITDEPLIDEGTLTIDAVAVGVTIDNANIGDV